MSWRRKGFFAIELSRPEPERLDAAEAGVRCRCGVKILPGRPCLRCEPFRAPDVAGADAAIGRGTATLTKPLAAVLDALWDGPLTPAELAAAAGLDGLSIYNRLKRLAGLGFARRAAGTLRWNVTLAGVRAREALRAKEDRAA